MDRLNHNQFMRLAIRLAQKAAGRTSPNPLVGAVVVKKGKIIGRGYHRASGAKHAETAALDMAGKSARGASLYVNLEPCCHFGKTGPCVQRIVEAGIKKVVFAMTDPNPLNNGKGAQFLRRRGVKVVSGVLEEDARRINSVFIKYITRQMPFVTVKVAQSIDGKIASISGDSRWISSPASRRLTHRLRRRADAVLVGVNTVLKDNPLLSCRMNGSLDKRQPKKIIIDSRLRLNSRLKIFSPDSPAEVIIATTKFAPAVRLSKLGKKARIIISGDKERRVNLKDLLRKLAAEGIAHILVEGGGEIIASMLKDRLVDRMLVIIAPKIIGGRNAPTAVGGRGIAKIKSALPLKEMHVRKFGADLVLECTPD